MNDDWICKVCETIEVSQIVRVYDNETDFHDEFYCKTHRPHVDKEPKEKEEIIEPIVEDEKIKESPKENWEQDLIPDDNNRG